jgi:hypothetical protein
MARVLGEDKANVLSRMLRLDGVKAGLDGVKNKLDGVNG